MYFVNDRSFTLTLPDPPPPPMWAVPDCERPQLHDRTSISSLCFPSSDSPLTPSILKNMSTAISPSPQPPTACWSCPPSPIPNCLSLRSYLPPLADGSLDTSRRDTVRPSS